MVFPESALGGYALASRPPKLVDQSLPNFFAERRRNRGRSDVCPILNIFIHSGDSRLRTLKSSEIEPNFACF